MGLAPCTEPSAPTLRAAAWARAPLAAARRLSISSKEHWLGADGARPTVGSPAFSSSPLVTPQKTLAQKQRSKELSARHVHSAGKFSPLNTRLGGDSMLKPYESHALAAASCACAARSGRRCVRTLPAGVSALQRDNAATALHALCCYIRLRGCAHASTPHSARKSAGLRRGAARPPFLHACALPTSAGVASQSHAPNPLFA